MREHTTIVVVSSSDRFVKSESPPSGRGMNGIVNGSVLGELWTMMK
jgi:hypothetical protein